MKDKCLICNKNNLNYRLFYHYRIIKCKDCDFLFIKNLFKKNLSNTSTSEDYYNGIKKDDIERENLFSNIIAKKRIFFYNQILKRKINNILEIGCGTAASSKGFLNNNIHYTGIENNRNIYNFAKKKSRNVLYGNFLKHKFKKKFDIIFASQVLEHIIDPNEFISKCSEILKKDGIIHVDVPNNNSLVSICRKILPGKKRYGALEPLDHMRAYSSKSLKNLFLNHGFKIILLDSFENDDRIFGQLKNNIVMFKKFFFYIQNIFNRNSLLVGIFKKF